MRFRFTGGVIAATALIVAMLIPASLASRGADAAEPAPPPERPQVVSFSFGGGYDCVARYARPSTTPAYGGYFVGGGSAIDGEPRFTSEGTWGWDYFGHLFQRRIALDWWHGERYQGGIGAYKPNGPKLHP